MRGKMLSCHRGLFCQRNTERNLHPAKVVSFCPSRRYARNRDRFSTWLSWERFHLLIATEISELRPVCHKESARETEGLHLVLKFL